MESQTADRPSASAYIMNQMCIARVQVVHYASAAQFCYATCYVTLCRAYINQQDAAMNWSKHKNAVNMLLE